MRSIAIAIFLIGTALASGCAGTPKTPEERSKAAVTLYKEGVQQFNDGKIDAGIQALKKANELQPGYTLLRYDLGRMLLVRAERSDIASANLGEEAKVLKHEKKLEEAKQKEDEAVTLHRTVTADLQEAVDHFRWAAQAWPGEANVPYFLSIAETGLGDYKQARDYLKQAIELGNPTGPQKEKLDRALDLLEKAELQQQRLEGKR